MPTSGLSVHRHDDWLTRQQMLQMITGICDSQHLLEFKKNKIINAIFFSEIYAKCNTDVFGSFIFRQLHLKYKKS